MTERREKVAAFYLKKLSQSEIARKLSIGQSTVSRDIAAVQEAWLQSSLFNLNARKAEELARLDRVEREAWEAWERSQRDAETIVSETVDEDGEQRSKDYKRTEGQCGDPRFLTAVMDCVEMRLKVLGIVKPGETNVNVVTINWDEIAKRKPRVDPVEDRIATLGQTS